MQKRINISSGTPWEDKVGYCRAVRIGNTIEVSGTTSFAGDSLIGKNDLYSQTKFIILKIEKALQNAGAELTDVVRTRMYVTDISKWEEAAKAHAEFFIAIKPVTTLVEVSRLIDPDMLIEIEASAVIQ
ncbi:RidA family protein [Daejeonella sp.]|jgi:enamine deaminase RidA (YjgF/YER057c/UK114 family)|uniref:RidA family protein n=1 Tax=Daejeonella sp. TaxID=2805397 RepID=UPI0027B9F031|nr:RidA family protein [Daejeonella sp.]